MARPRHFTTKLGVEECKNRLRQEASTAWLLPEFRGKEFIARIKGNRFWLWNGDHRIWRPAFQGAFEHDDIRDVTLIVGRFGPNALARALLLPLVAGLGLVAYSLVRQAIHSPWPYGLHLVLTVLWIALNVYLVKGAWIVGTRETIRFLRRVFEATSDSRRVLH